MQAHQALVHIRPDPDAPPRVWLAYYQRSVAIYEQIAETDPGHDGEALYWAQRERTRAATIATHIRTQPSMHLSRTLAGRETTKHPKD